MKQKPQMSQQALQRLAIEYENVEKAIDEGVIENLQVSLGLVNNSKDFTRWKVVLYGREGTIWEGGEFMGELRFPAGYPEHAPDFYWDLYGPEKEFQHMNIYESGRTCIDILNTLAGYKPATNCVEILRAMEELLYKPNPKSPTPSMHQLADLYLKDMKAYEKHVKSFVITYMQEVRDLGITND